MKGPCCSLTRFILSRRNVRHPFVKHILPNSLLDAKWQQSSPWKALIWYQGKRSHSVCKIVAAYFELVNVDCLENQTNVFFCFLIAVRVLPVRCNHFVFSVHITTYVSHETVWNSLWSLPLEHLYISTDLFLTTHRPHKVSDSPYQ